MKISWFRFMAIRDKNDVVTRFKAAISGPRSYASD